MIRTTFVKPSRLSKAILPAALLALAFGATRADAQVVVMGPPVGFGPRVAFAPPIPFGPVPLAPAPVVAVPTPVVPAVTTYRPATPAYQPVAAPTYVAPASVSVPAPVTSYRPVVAAPVVAVPVVPAYRAYYRAPARIGPGIGGFPNVYLRGQPVRNALRFAIP